MAEDVNFPLDQGRTTSAFQGLRQSADEAGRPRRIEDQEEELRSPDRARAREERPVNELADLSSRSEISTEGRASAEAQNPPTEEQEPDIAAAERRELQSNRQEVAEDARADSRNPRSQGPAGANELSRVSGTVVENPRESFEENFTIGNDVANPDAIDEFQTSNQIDSIQEAVRQAGEAAISTEPENPGAPLEEPPSIRELAESGGGPRGRVVLEQLIAPETPRPEETQQAELQENRVAASDARIQERLNEERAAEEASRARNEPAIETPEQRVEQVEPPEEPIEEAQDINPLRGPRPSELQDESDASAVETERGQNVSELI